MKFLVFFENLLENTSCIFNIETQDPTEIEEIRKLHQCYSTWQNKNVQSMYYYSIEYADPFLSNPSTYMCILTGSKAVRTDDLAQRLVSGGFEIISCGIQGHLRIPGYDDELRRIAKLTEVDHEFDEAEVAIKAMEAKYGWSQDIENRRTVSRFIQFKLKVKNKP